MNTVSLNREAVGPLRQLQRINAAFSGLTGVAMAAASDWLSRQIDLPRLVVAVLGVALVVWSVLLVLLAGQPVSRLVPLSRLVATGDAGWVLGSIVLMVVGALTRVGFAIVGAAAAIVAGFAVMGFALSRRAWGMS